MVIEDMMEDNDVTYQGVDVLLQYLEILFQRRIIFIAIFLTITFGSLVKVLLTPASYVAITTVLPGKSSEQSPLRSIAAAGLAMGITMPTGGYYSSLYEPILTSRGIITNVLMTKFTSPKTGEKLPLINILDVNLETDEERLGFGYLIFQKAMLSVSVDKMSGITTIKIESESPKLSAGIARAMVKELDMFIRETNIEKAKENKAFINERLDETLNLLQEAEQDLKNFRENNKRIEKSPNLQLQQGRLLREVRIQEELYLTLKKELEMAKIEEVKSLPMVKVLDKAVPPISKYKPRRTYIMTVSIFFAFILGVAGSFGWNMLSNIYSKEDNKLKIRSLTSQINKDYNYFKTLVFRSKTSSDAENHSDFDNPPDDDG